MSSQFADRRRVRFRDAEAIRRRLGEAWPDAFSPGVLDAFTLEVEGLDWDQAADATLALASELAGIGARRLRTLLDRDCSVQICHAHLKRGRSVLDRLRRPVARIRA